MKENRRMSTCNRLDLESVGSQPIMPKNLPDLFRLLIYENFNEWKILGNHRFASLSAGLPLMWVVIGTVLVLCWATYLLVARLYAKEPVCQVIWTTWRFSGHRLSPQAGFLSWRGCSLRNAPSPCHSHSPRRSLPRDRCSGAPLSIVTSFHSNLRYFWLHLIF